MELGSPQITRTFHLLMSKYWSLSCSHYFFYLFSLPFTRYFLCTRSLYPISRLAGIVNIYCFVDLIILLIGRYSKT